MNKYKGNGRHMKVRIKPNVQQPVSRYVSTHYLFPLNPIGIALGTCVKQDTDKSAFL